MKLKRLAPYATHELFLVCILSLMMFSVIGDAKSGTPADSEKVATNAEWCRNYEKQLLGLVFELTDTVLFNIRVAMREVGLEAEQAEFVMSFSKHPSIASYVEQKHGRKVVKHYEALLSAVNCLNPVSD